MKIFWLWRRSASDRNQNQVLRLCLLKTLMTIVMAKGFRLVDKAMAIFDEHDPDCMRSCKR